MEKNPLKFNNDDIPQRFRHLSEFARRFGHPEYTETVQPDSVSPEDLLSFWAAVAPMGKEIRKWLDEFPNGERWPDGPAAYLYMLQALDYAEPDSRESEEQRRRFWESTIYPNLLKKASKAAEFEFRNENYSGVIVLLEPYESDLSRVENAKLAFARKKTAEQNVTPNA